MIENSNKLIKKIAAVTLLMTASIGLSACTSSQETTNKEMAPQETASTAMSETTAAPSSMMMASTYKDGVYSVVGSYTSPGGAEELGVKITLKDGVITEAEVTPKAERPISVKMQGVFSEGYKTMVVGKKLDEVKLDKVGGSSLTPKGFNDAIEKVKTEAKA